MPWPCDDVQELQDWFSTILHPSADTAYAGRRMTYIEDEPMKWLFNIVSQPINRINRRLIRSLAS